jgi:hypothetical protein
VEQQLTEAQEAQVLFPQSQVHQFNMLEAVGVEEEVVAVIYL